jgi:hypothetical protein
LELSLAVSAEGEVKLLAQTQLIYIHLRFRLDLEHFASLASINITHFLAVPTMNSAYCVTAVVLLPRLDSAQ